MFPYQFSTASKPQYTYPDGTQGSRRPRDGEYFVRSLNGSHKTETFQWDDFLGHWVNVGNGEKVEFEAKTATSDIKCECGSESTGSNRHSTWCNKFVNQP